MQKIRHVGIVVKDLDKAELFYTKILGLKWIGEDTETGEYIQNLLGIPVLQWVKYATRAGDVVEVYELDEEENNNFYHIAFSVPKLSRIVKKLQKHKIKCSSIQKDKHNKHLVAFCRDYDGNLIELVEEINEPFEKEKSSYSRNYSKKRKV
jgi:catechol 2,3-dioxygenase-like lactoylglutathione lyase family enzyme